RPYPPHRPREGHPADAGRKPRRNRAPSQPRWRRGGCRGASRRRAGQPAPSQDRERSHQSAVPASGARRRVPASGADMTSIDIGFTRLKTAAERLVEGYGRVDRFFKRLFKSVLPKGLYARALLIIIAPMFLLTIFVSAIFMERHWNTVARGLSVAVVHDIAAVIDMRRGFPQDRDYAELRRIAQDRLGLVVDFLPVTELPPIGPKPFFAPLDQALSEELRKQVGRPFWIDTVGRSNLVEIRIELEDTVMRTFAHRSAAYESNSVIFLLWMGGTSLVLITVAILFLRNQIRPILRLTEAVESFGKGRDVPNFRARGAREVRRAAVAFIEMKAR